MNKVYEKRSLHLYTQRLETSDQRRVRF